MINLWGLFALTFSFDKFSDLNITEPHFDVISYIYSVIEEPIYDRPIFFFNAMLILKISLTLLPTPMQPQNKPTRMSREENIRSSLSQNNANIKCADLSPGMITGGLSLKQ